MAASPEKNKNERVYRMAFGSVYPLYVQKAERKGRSAGEVDEIIAWLTGYGKKEIEYAIKNGTNLESFFNNAPRWNRNAAQITGTICGYKVEEIEDELIRKVRYLDKLIDELAKGKAMAKILRSNDRAIDS